MEHDSINPYKDVKIRKKFPGDFDPSTKIEQPKTQKKNRASEKQALKKMLDKISSLEDLDDLDDIEF